MAGTKAGGAKARETNMAKYGANYYAEIGAKGGRNGNTGGFASESKDKNGLTGPERARIYGAIGGKISKRGPARNPRRTGFSAGLTPGSRSKQ